VRSLLVLAGLASGCYAPLQVGPGIAVGNGGTRPYLQVSGGFEDVFTADHRNHEAVWLGTTYAYERELHAERFFLGPEIQVSRVSEPRSRFAGLDVLCLRPEMGVALTGRRPTFFGGSLQLIHAVRRIPFTLSVRAGNFDSGPDRGFYGSIGLGVVAGSPLYWMQ
jgi:hypothetical protein